MTVWASIADVSAVTGKNVAVAELAEAESVICLFVGRTTDDRIVGRDLYWLKQAVSWQAVWQAEQVAFASRSHAQSVSQDGLAVQTDHDWQTNLAPLAARALRNLSWKRTRVTSARSTYISRNFVLESSDRLHRWSR